MKVGIIKEGKIPVDHRVPFSPEQCMVLKQKYPHIDLVVESSDIRCFKDSEYEDLGIEVVSNVKDCDILFGVKEVPLEQLVPGKTYFFFSHTIKKQPYNKGLLQKVLRDKITLIDYECLKKEGQRVVAFGRYAGIVGAYNGLLTFGKKYRLFDLKPAHQCFNMEEMWGEFEKIKLPPIKILLTGGGRVANGAQEVLDSIGIRSVEVEEYLGPIYEEPVYIQLDSHLYNKKKDGGDFFYEEFYKSPEKYESDFPKFLAHTDLLIAGAYWDPKAPVLFTQNDVREDFFKIRVVADITCDIQGSIPTTLKSTTIDAPFFDVERATLNEASPFSNEDNVTVMAVDNLPCELPRDASFSFGEQLLNNVTDSLFIGDNEEIIEQATIAKDGKLTTYYEYLTDYVK